MVANISNNQFGSVHLDPEQMPEKARELYTTIAKSTVSKLGGAPNSSEASAKVEKLLDRYANWSYESRMLTVMKAILIVGVVVGIACTIFAFVAPLPIGVTVAGMGVTAVSSFIIYLVQSRVKEISRDGEEYMTPTEIGFEVKKVPLSAARDLYRYVKTLN